MKKIIRILTILTLTVFSYPLLMANDQAPTPEDIGNKKLYEKSGDILDELKKPEKAEKAEKAEQPYMNLLEEGTRAELKKAEGGVLQEDAMNALLQVICLAIQETYKEIKEEKLSSLSYEEKGEKLLEIQGAKDFLEDLVKKSTIKQPSDFKGLDISMNYYIEAKKDRGDEKYKLAITKYEETIRMLDSIIKELSPQSEVSSDHNSTSYPIVKISSGAKNISITGDAAKGEGRGTRSKGRFENVASWFERKTNYIYETYLKAIMNTLSNSGAATVANEKEFNVIQTKNETQKKNHVMEFKNSTGLISTQFGSHESQKVLGPVGIIKAKEETQPNKDDGNKEQKQKQEPTASTRFIWFSNISNTEKSPDFTVEFDNATGVNPEQFTSPESPKNFGLVGAIDIEGNKTQEQGNFKIKDKQGKYVTITPDKDGTSKFKVVGYPGMKTFLVQFSTKDGSKYEMGVKVEVVKKDPKGKLSKENQMGYKVSVTRLGKK